MIISRFIGRWKQDTGKDDTRLEEAQAQKEADAAEPSADLGSVTKTLIVPPDSAKDITSESPDQSTEKITSDLNEMALRNVSKPSPKPSVTRKRKRQRSDSVETPPTKVMKTSGAIQHEDKPPVTSRNVTTGHNDASNRASLEAAKVVPGKLPRPTQALRHMMKTNPQSAPGRDEYDFPLSPGKQVQKSAPTPTTATTNPSSTNVTPRGRGRPRVGASKTKTTTSVEKSRGRKALDKVWKDKSDNVEASPGFQNRAISAQYEGEEDNRDEVETEGSEYTEGSVNPAGRKSTQTDEGDEEQAEENEDEELELFGQDKAWKTVLDGARSKCHPLLPFNHMPKRLIGRLKDLVYETSEARNSYEKLLPFKGLSNDGLDGLNDDLTKSFDAIEDHITKLSERNATKKASKIGEHLFTCAIPAMVFLLQSALASRVYHFDEPCALESLNETVYGLSEIVRLQKMTILLGEKATNWKAKPDPSIKVPTTRKILPCLRDMQKVFSNVLWEQDRKRKLKQNALDYRLRQKTLTESPQQAKQEAAKKDFIWQVKVKESREQEDQNRRDEKRTLRQVKEDEARARMGSAGVNGRVESKTIWSDAEDLALYFQLEKGYAGYLTSAERYLNILNTPLLQNKLPEHIRDRALYFKPTLLEQRGTLEWISSIE